MSTQSAFLAGVLKESRLNSPRQTGETTRGRAELELLGDFEIFSLTLPQRLRRESQEQRIRTPQR